MKKFLKMSSIVVYYVVLSILINTSLELISSPSDSKVVGGVLMLSFSIIGGVYFTKNLIDERNKKRN